MKKAEFKGYKMNDIVGSGCGIFLLVVIIIHIILGFIPVTATLKGVEVPAEAVTVTGSAPGRNADILVEVTATNDTIYQIKVLDHKETDKIGTKSVKELPRNIIEAQSLKVDAITGSSVTSMAITTAVKNALASADIKFGVDPAAMVPAPTNLDDARLAEYYGSAVFTDVPGGKVSDAGTVVYGTGYGAFSDVLVAVCFDTNDSIIGLIVDASGETEEKGIKCESREYTDLFIGVTSGKDVDVLSGASFTSWAIQDSVDYALANLELVKASA